MNKSEAFVYTTACSYIGAAAIAVAGYPSMANVSSQFQILCYLIAYAILISCLVYPQLRFPVATIYGVLAVLSFSGVQSWVNYSGSADFLGVAMALWDLVLAVSLLTTEATK